MIEMRGRVEPPRRVNRQKGVSVDANANRVNDPGVGDLARGIFATHSSCFAQPRSCREWLARQAAACDSVGWISGAMLWSPGRRLCYGPGQGDFTRSDRISSRVPPTSRPCV